MNADSLVTQQVELYTATSEAWKARHVEAMRVRGLEDALAFGVHVHDQLHTSLLRYVADVWNSPGAREEAFEQKLKQGFERWASSCLVLADSLVDCEARGFRVDHADAFRRLVAIAKEIPDRAWYKVTVLFGPEEDGSVSARLAELPGLATQAAAEDSLVKELVDAFQGVMASYRDYGKPVPWRSAPDPADEGECERETVLYG